jgi:transposase
MRGHDEQTGHVFSYVPLEPRVPADHRFAPDKLLRALLLQVLYTVRSERMLMEQLEYSLLFRWFVGLSMDDAV